MRIGTWIKATDGETGLREHIEHRLGFALGRFEGRILTVHARVTDQNGPKGGIDQLCRLEVRLRGVAPIFIEERAAGAVEAIDLAAGRAGRAVRRALDRVHQVRG